ncbi:hypothetical protein [Streptococcus suis]|nr:hypothetical protein [Streptococcus suis]
MAIGGAASGAIMSGYDAYSSGQRGWALAGSALKGAGLGAITGFVGGQFIGAGANVAANVTQNIANQTVRHVAKAGVEAGVETAIDTGISLATGNPITLKNVATDYGLNLITNGSGSVSSKKGAKSSKPKAKPKADIVNPYTGVREASQYLQEQGVPREYRKQILESFEIRTINVNQADSNTFGLRFYGGNANQEGRYLFETFTDLTNRKNLALPPSWNTMEGIAQFKLKEGTTYISGRVAPQLSMGPEYVGGATQWYVNDLTKLERLK